MGNNVTYIDVLLPLNLWQTYTYAVPFDLVEKLAVGKRAVVHFGKSKMYTAIILFIHHEKPKIIDPKLIDDILDEAPIIYPAQIALWKWISSYYMCTLGEVLLAALPSGLRLSSETTMLHNEAETYTDYELTPDEFLIAEALSIQRELSLQEVQQILQKKTIFKIVRTLFEKGIAIHKETIEEKYKPKLETYISLHENYTEEKELKTLFDTLEKKSTKQLSVLLAFMQFQKENTMVKSELILASDSTAAVLNTLKKNGVLVEHKKPISRIVFAEKTTQQIQLSSAQKNALAEIKNAFEQFPTVLLQGVTGSGKTEIYIQYILDAIAAGKKHILFLLPEIAITTQIMQRIQHYFGEDLLIYHSKFNEQERVEIWNNVLQNKYKIVLGARSALFLPFQKLDLIIVDEEHDSSYKQLDTNPHYHARDVAIYYASLFQAHVLLGSATPSLDSFYNVQTKKFGFVKLAERFGDAVLPSIELIDTKDATKKKQMQGFFSNKLVEEIQQVLEAKKQVILFYNRRGYAPYIECDLCSYIPSCTACAVSLTYHKFSHQLVCHYCGAKHKVPTKCGACGHTHLTTKGFGTEKIEDEIETLFPTKKIGRMDYDTTRGKESHKKIIDTFQRGETDILVGTQMLTKGLDFNNVQLVGVVNADQLLFFPEYKTTERAFQTLMQVSGRAGRKDALGKVLIQTAHTQHPILYLVQQHDVDEFLFRELAERQKFNFPPFTKLLKISVKHAKLETLEAFVTKLQTAFKKVFGAQILGPVNALVPRIQNKYIKEFSFKCIRDKKTLEKNKALLLDIILTTKSESGFSQIIVDILVDA